MKSLDSTPPAAVPPPDWLPVNLHKYWVSQAPDKLSVAGDYRDKKSGDGLTEVEMLERHVADMERGRSEFCIAPMGESGGVGTYRLGMK